MAMVTRGPIDVFMPAPAELVQGLHCGDPVLVDVKDDRLIGADGRMPVSGEVVTVESQPVELPNHFIVTHHDRPQLARLPHALSRDPTQSRPGTRVLFEPLRRIVLHAIDNCSTGDELLC